MIGVRFDRCIRFPESSLDATRVGQACPEIGVYEAIRLLEATCLCLAINARARWPLQATTAIETYNRLSRDEANAADKCTGAVGTLNRGHDVVARAGLKGRPSCSAVSQRETLLWRRV